MMRAIASLLLLALTGIALGQTQPVQDQAAHRIQNPFGIIRKKVKKRGKIPGIGLETLAAVEKVFLRSHPGPS